jgi:hypothetical protein
MLRALLPCLLLSLAAGGVPQSGPELADRWLGAVTEHMPGQADDWTTAIGDWSRQQLVSTLNEIQRRRTPDRALRRGAVLHLDIVLHGSPRVSGPLFTRYPSTGPRAPSATTFLVLDGREEGRGAAETHLEFARALLKELTPDARTEEFVRLWYDATATRLAAARNYAELLVHLDHARRLFPSDPEIMFASGFLHETFAAPRLQAVVGTASDTGHAPGIGSVGHNLSEAEHYYRRAVSVLPGFGEARLRLGRVLGLQGKHKLAVPELERALEDAEESTQSYYARLFLGREEEMLGRRDAAQRHFERAAALVPSAQAPQLALSRLALERGDERGAQEILNRILTAREGAAGAVDPWWDYETTPRRHVDRKLARMYRALSKEIE